MRNLGTRAKRGGPRRSDGTGHGRLDLRAAFFATYPVCITVPDMIRSTGPTCHPLGRDLINVPGEDFCAAPQHSLPLSASFFPAQRARSRPRTTSLRASRRQPWPRRRRRRWNVRRRRRRRRRQRGDPPAAEGPRPDPACRRAGSKETGSSRPSRRRTSSTWPTRA